MNIFCFYVCTWQPASVPRSLKQLAYAVRTSKQANISFSFWHRTTSTEKIADESRVGKDTFQSKTSIPWVFFIFIHGRNFQFVVLVRGHLQILRAKRCTHTYAHSQWAVQEPITDQGGAKFRPNLAILTSSRVNLKRTKGTSYRRKWLSTWRLGLFFL